MPRAVVGLAILVTACLVACLVACTGAASLQVDVVHDPDIVGAVARTVVSIYVQGGLTCDAIEFGDISDEQLHGALAAEASDGMPLTGIPRTDAKIVVARGYASDGTLVSAGCAALGVVDGDVAITIATVPTATVAIGASMTQPRGLVVETTDATNASIDKRAIFWRLFGAAGTSADPAMFHDVAEGVWEPTHPTCTTGGDATIHPMPPLLPGGYELQVRVSWATREPPLFSSFTQIDKSAATVATLVNSKVIAPCALERHGGGAPTIACLSSATTVDLYTYAPASRALAMAGQQNLPVIADGWVALVSVDEPTGDRNVYAISDLGAWQAIDSAPAAATGTWCAGAVGPLRCGGSYTTTSVTVVPACGDQPAYLLGASTDLGSMVHLRKQPIRGGTPTEFNVKDGTPIGAGCMTELQADGTSKLRQAVVVNLPKFGQVDPFSTAIFACSATKSPCSVPLPSVGQAVAFTDGAGGTEHQLIGTTFDASGAQLARWVVEPASAKGGAVGGKDRLIERTRQVAAASPRQLVIGQFDADGQPDLMWTFAARAEVDFQIAYAREVLGAPLSALAAIDTPTGINPQPIALFAADFNGDKFDELVFVFATTVLTATTTTLVVVPTGLPYASPPVATDDPTCP